MHQGLRRSLYVLGGLVILFPLFHAVENARGNRAWKTWQREREAAGDVFDPMALVPAPIPDANNFAAAPRVAAAIHGTQPLVALPPGWPTTPAGNWREGQRADLEVFRKAFPKGNLEQALAPYKEALDDLALAARRPSCRVPPTYTSLTEAGFPALLGFRAAARVLQLRALQALHTGHLEAAYQDVTTLLRMVEHFKQEPLLLCQLLRMALGNLALQPLWEGLAMHAWTQPQLTGLRAAVAKTDFLGSMELAWKEERAFHGPNSVKLAAVSPWSWSYGPPHPWEDQVPGENKLKALVRKLATPRGWILQNAVFADKVLKEALCDPLDPAKGRIAPRNQDALVAVFARRHFSPYTFMFPMVPPALTEQNIRAARTQTGFDQARTACDLELFRHSKGAYPEQLADLGGQLPQDPIDGRPLRYRRTPEGGYLLYSVGWNGVDDQGQPGHGNDPLRDGDWVWAIR